MVSKAFGAKLILREGLVAIDQFRRGLIKAAIPAPDISIFADIVVFAWVRPPPDHVPTHAAGVVDRPVSGFLHVVPIGVQRKVWCIIHPA